MERRDIEVFLVLAEELHFGRTAERLHVSQARVSQTIAALERRFGAPLFARTSRWVALTPLGTRLRDDLAPAFAQIDRAIARAVAAGRGLDGELAVAFEAPGVADLVRRCWTPTARPSGPWPCARPTSPTSSRRCGPARSTHW